MADISSPSKWCDDDDQLVQELRRAKKSHAAPRIPGYADLKELRRGGQGVVFVARQVSTSRTVAVKLVLDGALASREVRLRFEREVELVATLRHPNVVRIYDSGETDDGLTYYVMEFIEGAGLDEVIDHLASKHAPADPTIQRWRDLFRTERDVLAMFAKICDGVQHAHQKGVIHRDLKPSNVRIDPAGEPHVLDFGLAKLADASPEATRMSRTGSFMGSLPWASPEQADGTLRSVDVRSDVYSLGVMLFQMLTGEFPYRVDGTLRETLQNIQTTTPKSPADVRRDINDELATIALKCLAKEPERRYQSAGDLARDIRRYLAGEPIEAKRDSAWYSVRKTLDRYKTTVRAFSVLLICSLVFSIAMVLLRARAVDAERLAAQRLAALEIAHKAELETREALKAQIAKKDKVRAFLDSTLRAVDPWKHPGRDLGPLRELLDSAVARLGTAFPDQPEVEAVIAGTLGWDYRELGLNEPAEKLLRRSYELSCNALGEEHSDSMSALSNLATLLTDQARHAESEKLFAKLYELQKKTLGAEDPKTLVTLNNLALDLDWQGRSVEAEAMYRAALEAQTRILGEAHRDRLSTMNNLAACLPALGKMDEAQALQSNLIAIRTKAYGANDPETLQARSNLATILLQAGKNHEAEALLRELIKSMETVLTPNHPMTIGAMHNLADALSNLGRLDEALVLVRRAFDAQVAFSGPDHPTTLNRKNELACALIEAKRFDEAIPLATDLCRQYETLVGAADWRTLNSLGNLAFALNQKGDTKKAEALWNRIITTADPNHEASAMPVVTARANLAALLADQGRWAEAEAAFRAAIAAQEKMSQPDNWRTAYMRAGLGRVLAETDRLVDAEKLLTPAYDILRKALGDRHDRTQRVIGYIVRLYERTGNAPAATTFRQKVAGK